MKFYTLKFDFCISYLILNPKNNSCVLVDPNLNYIDKYLNIIKDKKAILKATIDTHTHCDHISASTSLKEMFNCNFIMNEHTTCKEINRKVKNHEILNIDGIILKCIHTPGHTLDSMCIIFEDKLLTGDTLFLEDGAGRNDLNTGNSNDHYNSLFKISKLPNHLIVCPSHDYSDSSSYSLYQLKKINPFLKLRNKSVFMKYSSKLTPPPKWMDEIFNINIDPKNNNLNVTIPKNEEHLQCGYARPCNTLAYFLKNKSQKEKG